MPAGRRAGRARGRACSPGTRPERRPPAGGALQWAPPGWIVAGQQGAPVDAGVPGAEVGQGEAIAGGLRRRLAAAHLAQIPVEELMAVEEAEHLAPGAKPDAPAEPVKGEPASRLAAGPG